MGFAIRRARLLGAAIGLAIAGVVSNYLSEPIARGAVNLTLAVPGSPTVTSGSYFIGNSFTLSVNASLTSTSNSLYAVDLYVQSSTSGAFQLTGRTPGFADDAYPATFPESMNPTNGSNLGGSSLSGTVLMGVSSNNLIDNLTFFIPTSTAAAKYTISFVLATTDYQLGPPSYNTTAFDSLGSFTATVLTPEPASLSVLGIAGLGLLRRRRCV